MITMGKSQINCFIQLWEVVLYLVVDSGARQDTNAGDAALCADCS